MKGARVPGSRRAGGRNGVLIGHKTRRLILFIAAAVSIAVVPTALALAVTYGAAVEHARTRLGDVAARSAERVRTVLWSAEGVLSSVDYAARQKGCSGELVSTFAAAAATYDWIRGLSFMNADGRLACTSYGAFDPPLPVPERQLSLLGDAGSAVRFTAPYDTAFCPAPRSSPSMTCRTAGTRARGSSPPSLPASCWPPRTPRRWVPPVGSRC